MHVFLNLVILLTTTMAMELVAWASHRYLMHGPGWTWHASHHARRQGLLEKNDLFALCFSFIAIALIWFGVAGAWPLQWIGAGMTLYGGLYFLVHDAMVHRRWPVRFVPRTGYLRRLYQAHVLHHASASKDDGVQFGFLLAPSEARLKAALDAHRLVHQTSTRDVPRAQPQAAMYD